MAQYRGMAGAVRKSVEDANLEHKIRIDGILYNDKMMPDGRRRFNWDRCIKQGMTEDEENRFFECVNDNLEDFGLVLEDNSYVGTGPGCSIIMYATSTTNGVVERLKKEAAELGYKLVKIS